MNTLPAVPAWFKYPVILCSFGLHVVVTSASVPLDPALARMPTVARITAAPVFEYPIQFTGHQPPPAEESESLWAAIDVLREYGQAAGVPALELFVETYAHSAWTPSVRNNLGYYYRSIGRYSLALEHWQAAWEASNELTGERAKGVADFALAHWTRLLASLGRRETLDAIYRLTQGRLLDGGPLQQSFNATREGFSTMVREPGVAYRCGTLALWQVGRVLQPGNTNVHSLLGVPSPETGFSLGVLKSLSDELQLKLVAVERVAGSELVVPSVVHWKLDHYAAITARKGNRYQVQDPTFEQTIWMDAETINAEASGFFLIPSDRQVAGWQGLVDAESRKIFGRGYPYTFDDDDAEDCPKDEDGDDGDDPTNPLTQADAPDPAAECPTCNDGGGPDDSAANDAGCSGCELSPGNGMPTWRVVEPYMSLKFVDKPMRYTKANAKRQAFRVVYKQRNTRANAYAFGFGPFWECNRLSYFRQDAGGGFTHWVPGGGKRIYTDGVPEYKTRAIPTITADIDGNVTSVVLLFPNSASVVLGYVNVYYIGSRDIFVTSQTDRWGRAIAYNYTTTAGKVYLNTLVDHDNRTTSFSYGNGSFPQAITQATDPYGRSVQMLYDSSGRMTNIVDAAGLGSSFVYDAQGWVTNLVTPYGTTVFQITGTSTNFGGEPIYDVHRSCTVTEPNGSKQLFIYRWNTRELNAINSTEFIASWPENEVPTLPYTTTFNTYPIYYHHTFHWNRQQYAALNATFRSSGDFDDLTVADYDLARLRNWLIKGWPLLGGTLNMQREGSPDGTARGQTTWYDYPGKNNTYAMGSTSFPSTIARVLPNGQTNYTYIERNTNNRPTLIVTSYGDGTTARTNTFVYHANEQDLHYELGPNGDLQRGYSYNANHQVLTFTNAAGDVTTYSYDGQSRLTQRILPTGLTNIFTYGTDGFVSKVTDLPINRTNSYTYLKSFVESHTDERGLLTTNYWDNLQRLTGIKYPDGTTISNIFTSLDLTATKDRLGYWSYFGYNAIRQKIAETNANGVITRYDYCDCGALGSITNAWNTSAQVVTSFGYDYQGNRLYTYYPDATVTNWFDSLRRVIATGDAWATKWFGYNNQGLLTSVTNAFGPEQLTTYDIEDRPIYVTDANGVTVTNTYDGLGRLRTRTAPDGGAEAYGYSARGLTAYTNQLGFITSYAYDEAARKTCETNANAEVIRYTNSAAGDLLALVDGKNQVTKWSYDEYGRVTNKLDQAAVEILRYTYDPDSRLTNRWSKAKGDTKYSYDPVGNLTNVDYAVSTDIKYEYDALNRLTKMVDASGTNVYAYAAGGQLYTEDGPWASDTVTNTYNNRLRTGLDLAQPTGKWTNSFGYDAAKRLTSVASPAGTFSYTLGAAGAASPLPKKLLLPNTSYITNTYDSVARLKGTYLKNSGHTVTNKHEYAYNLGHQRINSTNRIGTYYTNTYDPIGQLKIANSSVNSEDRGYQYDAAWNLNYRTNNGSLYTWMVDGKNQLTKDHESYTNYYDGNGNLTNRYSVVSAALNFGYDDENQLTSAEKATQWRSVYVYDGKGRMRKRLTYTWSGSWTLSTTTLYVYDGMRVIQERNASNVPQVSYTRGSDLSGSLEGAGGIGGLLGRSHAYQTGSGNWTNHNFYHADGNGNVTYMVNSAQSRVAEYGYDPYGNTISTAGTLATANVYRFSSKEVNADSGLYYYGYRFYDPNSQRWLNRDPIQEHGGFNLYTFLANYPVGRVDLFGLDYYPSLPPSMPYYTPPRPETPHHDPNVAKAKEWLKKCHPSLCNGNPRTVDFKNPWFYGNAIVPGIILLDSRGLTVGEIVNVLAHECMHKKNGYFSALVDLVFDASFLHNTISDTGDLIQGAYERDPNGNECPKKCK